MGKPLQFGSKDGAKLPHGSSLVIVLHLGCKIGKGGLNEKRLSKRLRKCILKLSKSKYYDLSTVALVGLFMNKHGNASTTHVTERERLKNTRIG